MVTNKIGNNKYALNLNVLFYFNQRINILKVKKHTQQNQQKNFHCLYYMLV